VDGCDAMGDVGIKTVIASSGLIGKAAPVSGRSRVSDAAALRVPLP
jgi:hypothetical protein